jgi:hypothetical protein
LAPVQAQAADKVDEKQFNLKDLDCCVERTSLTVIVKRTEDFISAGVKGMAAGF